MIATALIVGAYGALLLLFCACVRRHIWDLAILLAFFLVYLGYLLLK